MGQLKYLSEFSLLVLRCGSVAEWLLVRYPDLRSTGRAPVRIPADECNLGQVVYTCAYITKQYNLVAANGR